MIVKTKDFKDAANTILLAVDSCNMYAANLELLASGNTLYLNVTNKEYYCSVKFSLEEPADFRAVIDAKLFLSLISGIVSDTFTLEVTERNVVIKSGKSSYKLAMIYDNDSLMQLNPIILYNKTVEMPISNDILRSILNVNSKELAKIKNLDVSELQKLYYITNEGCFTFTNGACLNTFSLPKPIEILVNDRIVKLFKLFKEDPKFTLAEDCIKNGVLQTKISLETSDVYLAALITNDELLLEAVKRPRTSTKNFIAEKYANHLVVSANTLSAAISRLMLFTKNSIDKVNMAALPATCKIDHDGLSILDSLGNTEYIAIENGSYVDNDYSMILNLADLKLVLDSCKDEHITINCGNHHSVVIARPNIYHLLPEGVQA